MCELALRGVGVGIANPIVALDYVPRGLVLRPLAIDVRFRSLMVFRAGVPLSENARELLKMMRIVMERDTAELNTLLSPVASQAPRGRIRT